MNDCAGRGLGERALVVTAGRGDRGDATMRLLERLGVDCALLDLSSASQDAEKLVAAVRGAHEQLSGGRTPAIGLVAIGRAADPVLAVAAAPAAGVSTPGVLVVNGRFDSKAPRRAQLSGPGLLLLEDDASWAERRIHRRVDRDLGEHGELVVVRALAGDGTAVLRSWCGGRSPAAAGSRRRMEHAAVASSAYG